MDYVYLKNVLLQFLEQKDKKHQMQLIPVLGMLLHFDRLVIADRIVGWMKTNGVAAKMSRIGCAQSPRNHDVGGGSRLSQDSNADGQRVCEQVA